MGPHKKVRTPDGVRRLRESADPDLVSDSEDDSSCAAVPQKKGKKKGRGAFGSPEFLPTQQYTLESESSTHSSAPDDIPEGSTSDESEEEKEKGFLDDEAEEVEEEDDDDRGGVPTSPKGKSEDMSMGGIEDDLKMLEEMVQHDAKRKQTTAKDTAPKRNPPKKKKPATPPPAAPVPSPVKRQRSEEKAKEEEGEEEEEDGPAVPMTKEEEEELENPNLPSSKEALDEEKEGLEGAGTAQLRDELPALEATGAKLLREDKAAHDFIVWLRKLLRRHNSAHIRFALTAKVGNLPRAYLLFNRCRRRYWAKRRETGESEERAGRLPVGCGEGKVWIPLDPSEVGFMDDSELPSDVQRKLGGKAAGMKVPFSSIDGRKDAEDIDEGETVVVIFAEALNILEVRASAGVVGMYQALVHMKLLYCPLRGKGYITGIVTDLQKPQYDPNLPLSKPVSRGRATLSIDSTKQAIVSFGAEVPSRALALGRIWSSKLQKDPLDSSKLRLAFAMDAALHTGPGDHSNLMPLDLHTLEKNRVTRKGVQVASGNWATAVDETSGWRILMQLPADEYWLPTTAELEGDHVIRGIPMSIRKYRRLSSAATDLDTSLVKATVFMGDPAVVSGKYEVTAAVELVIQSKSTTFRVTGRHSNKAAAANKAAAKVARNLEVRAILMTSSITPSPGTLTFHVEGIASGDVEGEHVAPLKKAGEKAKDEGKAKTDRPKKRTKLTPS